MFKYTNPFESYSINRLQIFIILYLKYIVMYCRTDFSSGYNDIFFNNLRKRWGGGGVTIIIVYTLKNDKISIMSYNMQYEHARIPCHQLSK